MREIVAFGGIMPRLSAALLPENAAQDALNCTLWKKDLRPLKQPLAVVTPTALGSAIRSIYRIGQTLPETQYWMAWTQDVDVVRGMVAGDTSERTYFTGNGAPKVTDLTTATQGGTAYPVNAYTLGIPKPANALTCVPSSSAAPVETRIYIYTYVSAWGEEGKPSDPTKVVVAQGGSVALSNMAAAPTGNYNITKKRIYRSQSTDTGSAIYEFVTEIPVGTATFNDNIAATALGEELATADYDMPPATMQGIVALPNGIFAGFDGYDILFCEPFVSYAWPVKYRQTADALIVGLGVFGASLVVLTKDKPYLLSGSHPENMSMEKLDVAQACVAKRSIVSADGGVIYAGPDGLIYVGSGGAKILTQERMTRDDWQALNPAGMSAYFTDGKYVACHASGGGFILDLAEGGEITRFDEVVTAGYVDAVNDALYLCIAGQIKKFNAGADKSYVWKSKAFMDNGRVPHAFGMLDAEAYPVNLQIYWDGVLVYDAVIASERPFALPGGQRPRQVEYVLSGTNPVRYLALANDIKELRLG